MKKIVGSIAVLAITSNMLMAGGDFTTPVEPEINMPTQDVVILEDDVKYDGFYAGMGANHMRMSEAVTSSGYGITLMAGYYFNKYVGVEARYMTTVSDLDLECSRPIVTTSDTLSNVGLYIKPMYAVTTGFSLYGLAGYGQSTYEKNGVDFEEEGFQWGLGAKYELANGVGLFVDYLDMYDDDNFDGMNVEDVQFGATTVGATYTF
jgi:opacity protein-like surface antigen